MKEIFCEVCHLWPKTRVKWNKYVCDICEPVNDFFPALVNTVELKVGGKVTKTTKEEVIELKRLRSIPKPNGKGWYAARLGDNGKLQERSLKA